MEAKRTTTDNFERKRLEKDIDVGGILSYKCVCSRCDILFCKDGFILVLIPMNDFRNQTDSRRTALIIYLQE